MRRYQVPIRGRGRDSGRWNQHDSRFSYVDIASQIVQQMSIPLGMFVGRGLLNGGMDTLHPLAIQGTYRSMNPSLNMGLMEQGVNRIVVEDVQV